MAEHGVILATKDGAKALQTMLAQNPSLIGNPTTHLDPDHTLDPMLIELLQLPEDGDDYRQQTTRQVRRVNDEMRFLQELKIRLLGGRPLIVQTGTQLTAVSTHLHAQVQLVEDLEPAVDSASYVGAPTDPLPTALANVLTKDANGGLTRLMVDGSPEQVRVVNRNEHWETVEAETVGRVLLINDEWQPDDFDCEPRTGGLIT